MESGRQPLTYLDTHIAVWLCTGDVEFSKAAAREIETAELRISPMVELELKFLRECHRLNAAPEEFLTILRRDFDVTVCPIPFQAVTTCSLDDEWTRDPFDRVIVGHARAAGAKLVTKDRKILDFFPDAVW